MSQTIHCKACRTTYRRWCNHLTSEVLHLLWKKLIPPCLWGACSVVHYRHSFRFNLQTKNKQWNIFFYKAEWIQFTASSLLCFWKFWSCNLVGFKHEISIFYKANDHLYDLDCMDLQEMLACAFLSSVSTLHPCVLLMINILIVFRFWNGFHLGRGLDFGSFLLFFNSSVVGVLILMSCCMTYFVFTPRLHRQFGGLIWDSRTFCYTEEF